MSLRTYVTYDKAGRICSVLSCQEELADMIIRANTKLPYVRVDALVNEREFFIVDQAPMPRPYGTAVLEGNWLKAVPAGASVTIEGQMYTADGSDIELEFSHPGSYTITISKWPYRDQEVTYENTA